MTPTAEQLEGIEAAAQASLYQSQGLRVERVVGVTVLLAPDVPSADLNRAIGLGVTQASEELLDRVIGLYEGPTPFFLQVIPEAQPSALHDWIRARGFTPRRRWVKTWREASSMPLGPSAVRVSTVAGPDRSRFAQTMERGFNMPTAAEPALAAMVGGEGWRCYFAHIDGSLAGAASLYCEGDLAYLAMGCALPEFRRRGVQAALMERRIADAHAAGARFVVSDAAEDIPKKPNPSLHNMIRLGFREAYKRENYQRG